MSDPKKKHPAAGEKKHVPAAPHPAFLALGILLVLLLLFWVLISRI
jgi:hypothetical protein